MKKIMVTIALILIIARTYSVTSGEYGFQMLKLISDANSAAQAGTGALSSADAFSFLLNPAAGLVGRIHAVSVSQNYWFFDTKMSSISYSNYSGKSGFGLAFRQLDYGKFDKRDEAQNIIGAFHPIDLNFTYNLSYRITPDHYIGLNSSLIFEKIDTASSYGVSFDFGYIFLTPIKQLFFSTSLKHLGVTSQMIDQNIELPLTYEAGFTKSMNLRNFDLSTEAKYIKHQDNDVSNFAFGFNCSVMKILILKLGYKLNYDSEDFSTGIGINYKKTSIDYTFIPLKHELDDVHMFGISYRF